MDHMVLIGTEQMQSAASGMMEAARKMQNVVSELDETLTRHERLIEEWLVRFEQAVADMGCAAAR